MNRQLVYLCTFGGVLGESPTLESIRTGVEYIIDIGASQGRREWDVEGQIDGRVDTRGRSHRWSAVWPAKSHVGVRSGHPKGRRHSFPTMTGLARKVGDLVHDREGRNGESLTPTNNSKGKEGRRIEGGRGR